MLKSLRARKGWRVADLAREARRSRRTIENCEGGRFVYLHTIASLANALGVGVGDLIEDGQVAGDSEGPPRRLGGIEITVRLHIPYEDFDEADGLASFLEALVGRLTMVKGEVQVGDVREGSVEIDLRFTEEQDGRRLVRMYCGMRLGGLGIDGLVVPSYEGIGADISGALTGLVGGSRMEVNRQLLMVTRLREWVDGGRAGSHAVTLWGRDGKGTRFTVTRDAASDRWSMRVASLARSRRPV
ncbi:helix-turn-helix domain-containing protein [Tautonia rosea]|uniref:helix-turn-helix domain-containing protein n=1 Tax=Tautonia rosea TaxID=2728037 RepID=UPI001472F05E|nr:helix-turn-helix transcriptional regulator [Tautonia rosea]